MGRLPARVVGLECPFHAAPFSSDDRFYGPLEFTPYYTKAEKDRKAHNACQAFCGANFYLFLAPEVSFAPRRPIQTPVFVSSPFFSFIIF
jgi:hypothetical protein